MISTFNFLNIRFAILIVLCFAGLQGFGQTVLNSDLNDAPNLWKCDVLAEYGVEVNYESVYGGVSTTNLVAEIDATVVMCQYVSGFIPGQVYEFTFDCSGRTSTCGPDVQSMLVTVDGGVLSEEITKGNVDFELQNERFCFTATSETHLISFVSTTEPAVSCGVVVDNVYIVPYYFHLGGDQVLCEGENVLLDAGSIGSSYEWQDGSTGSTFMTDGPGTYSVEVAGEFCPVADEVTISYTTNEPDLGSDLSLCQGETAILDVGVTDATYEWQDESTGATFVVSEPGVYDVDVTVGNCTVNEEIEITYNMDQVNLGENMDICVGDNATLIGDLPGATYVWQDGSTNETLDVSVSGNYSVVALINGCSSTDEIEVTFNDVNVDLGADISFCEGSDFVLSATTPDATYLWQDGSIEPELIVNQSGTYSVIVTVDGCSANDEINITVDEIPAVDLGNDLILCPGETTIIDATWPNATYLWQNGEEGSNYLIDEPGTFSVIVNANGCESSDEINVSYSDLVLDLGGNQSLCEGESAILDASNSNASYLWQDGSSEPTFEVTSSGTYSVTVSQDDCSLTESVELTFGSLEIDLGEDLIICDGSPIILDASTSGASYLWQNGSTASTYTVSESGTYEVEVSSGSCTANDEINVIMGSLSLNLGGDQSLCEGESTILDATNTGATYLWQDGSTNPTFDVTESGTYSVTVSQGECSLTESVEINFGTLEIDLGEDLSLCTGETLTLNPSIPGATYTWQDGSTNESYIVTTAGTYSVNVTAGSCSASDEIDVSFGSLSFSLGNDTSLCVGDELILQTGIIGGSYLWQDGSEAENLSVTESGIYNVEVNTGTCTATDEILVTFNEIPQVNLGADASYCEGQEITLDASYPNATYLWQNSATASTFEVTEAGVYSVDVTVEGCTGYDNVTISFSSINVDLGEDIALCEGENVTLDASIDDATYLWDDGSTEPTLTVSASGSYSVTVTTAECVGTGEVSVSIGIPNVDLGNDTTLCEGTALLLDAFVPGASYEWQDGSSEQTLEVLSSGNYGVEITIGDCSANSEIYVEFIEAPAVDLGPDQQICEGSYISFDASWPDADYEWQDLSSGGVYTTNLPGDYWVSVSIGTCTTTDSITISTGIPNIDLGNDTTMCAGLNLTLSPSGASGNYTWQDGSTNDFFTVTEAGLYSIQIEIDGCVNSDSLYVNYAPLPSASISGGMIHCPDELVNLLVDINGTPPFLLGFTKDGVPLSSVETSAFNYALSTDDSGVYEVSSVLDAFCYSGPQNNTTITDYPPLSLNMNYNDEICQGESVTLYAQVSGGNGDVYSSEWIDENGNEFFENPITLVGDQDLTLTYTGTDLCGTPIEGTAEIEVQIPPTPVVTVATDSICQGSELLLNSNNDDENISCIWIFENGEVLMDCGPINTTYEQSGFQGVTLTMQTTAGCEASTTYNSLVYVMPLPDADFAYSGEEGTIFSPGIQFENHSDNSVYHSWNFGDGTESEEYSPLHFYPEDVPDEYIVCLTAINNLGCIDTHCSNVEISPELVIHIPNSFTPDEDGINDLFRPVINEIDLAEYSLSIYDRGGQIIFDTNDQNQFWNGSNRYTKEYYVPDGVYNYHILLREEGKSETKEYRGNITLLR